MDYLYLFFISREREESKGFLWEQVGFCGVLNAQIILPWFCFILKREKWKIISTQNLLEMHDS